MMGRKGVASRGGRKIEIKLIQSEDARYVCFSKRKSGIFAKASDISTLCGADVAVLVHSPAGNPYSFGSPSVETVVDRFISGNPVQAGAAAGAGRSNVIQQLNQQYMEVSTHLEVARARKGKLRERLAGSVIQSREIEWAKNIDSVGLDQLDRLEGFLRLKRKADDRINEILGGGGGCQTIPVMSLGALGIDLAGGEAPPPSSFTFRGFSPMQSAANQVDFVEHSTSCSNVGKLEQSHELMNRLCIKSVELCSSACSSL